MKWAFSITSVPNNTPSSTLSNSYYGSYPWIFFGWNIWVLKSIFLTHLESYLCGDIYHVLERKQLPIIRWNFSYLVSPPSNKKSPCNKLKFSEKLDMSPNKCCHCNSWWYRPQTITVMVINSRPTSIQFMKICDLCFLIFMVLDPWPCLPTTPVACFTDMHHYIFTCNYTLLRIWNTSSPTSPPTPPSLGTCQNLGYTNGLI